MSPRNSELANKLKAALIAAGVEIPKPAPAIKDSRVMQQARPSKRKDSARKAFKVDNNKQVKSSKATRKRKLRRAKRVSKRPTPVMAWPDNTPSLEAIRAAYGAPTKTEPVKKSQNTVISLNKEVFKPNLVFGEKVSHREALVIDEPPCVTQLGSNPDLSIELVIGLDLGTSNSKVVIGDPANKKFYAVSFCQGSANPYLLPTSISILHDGGVIIAEDERTEPKRDIKLYLMQEDDRAAMVDVAAYIAQVVRYSINWFLLNHSSAYCDAELVWTMAVGLPADAARQGEIESRFRLTAITGAQAALVSGPVCLQKVNELLQLVEEDITKLNRTGEESRFEELGADPGIVVVVPEVAAQVVGLYKSRRWDLKRPISFLLDIGAGTVDAAVFSLVNPVEGDEDLMFCAFSCNVSELGIRKLHLDRIDWLLANLPQDIVNRGRVESYLKGLKSLDQSISPVPGDIGDYVNTIQIQNGDINRTPDRKYRLQLSDNVFDGVLRSAVSKSQRDSAWKGLRALVCGGGARSPFYGDFLEKLSANNRVKLEVEPLEKPDNLIAPGLPRSEYDRLSVAYGLAQGTQWQYRWPEDIEDLVVKRNIPVNLVSKDLV